MKSLLLAALALTVSFAGTYAFAARSTVPSVIPDSSEDTQSEVIEIPPDLSPQDVEAFLAPLSDQQSRQLLLQQLKQQNFETQSETLEQPQNSFASFLQAIQSRAVEISNATDTHQRALSDIPESLQYIFRNLTDLRGAPAMWEGLWALSVMIAVGWIAAFAFTRLCARFSQRIVVEDDVSTLLRVLCAVLLLFMELAKVVLFTVVAYGVSFVFFERFDPMRYFVTTYLSVITVVWLSVVCSRVLFSPNDPAARLIVMPDSDAKSTHRWIVWITAATAMVFFTSGLFSILGLKAELQRLYIITGGGAVVVLLLAWIWQQRNRVASAMVSAMYPGSTGYSVRLSMAKSWHVFATVYLLAIWWLWASNILLQWEQQARAAVVSLMVLIVLPFADYFFGALMGLLLRNGSRDEEAQARMQNFVRLLQRSLRLVLIVIALIVLSSAWSSNLYAMTQSETGSVVFDSLITIGATLLLAFIAWEAVKIFIDPHIPEKPAEGTLDLEGDGGGVGGTRSETLLPLFRTFICIVLVVSVVMIVLSSLGADIAPLLAGAGVIGLAVGFGAQKLVQDIISGIFFLVDDAFRIGEYVEAGALRGTVESISLRSMKLRHHLGMVQTIPYGDISAITNHSRDWIIMKLEFRMPYDTDIEKVRKLIKKLGQEMQQHPEYGQFMLQPLKSQGVLRIEESTLIMRMKFTAVPGQQWVIRREAYRLVQEVFKENGLEFAHRKVLVEASPGTDLSDDDLQRAGAAVVQEETAALKKTGDDR